MKHKYKHRKRNIRTLVILLGIFMLSGLCACGNSRGGRQERNAGRTTLEAGKEERKKRGEEGEAGKEEGTEADNLTEETGQIEKQLQIITDYCMELWQKSNQQKVDEMYFFTVTDLDQNGRLEVISASVQGTGIYTYSSYLEVNEQSDGLKPCEVHTQKGDSEADIVDETVPVYYDEEADVYHYIFSDYIKDGAAVSYENIRDISLKNGEIRDNVLAYKESVWDESGVENADFFNGETREKINRELYESAADAAFADLKKKQAVFLWEGKWMSEWQEISREQMQDILQKSYEGFSIDEK